MKTTVSHPSDTRALLTITLDTTDLQDAEMVALKKLSKDVKVDGFRKGHVPLAVVAKHVDPSLLGQQVLDDAISKAVAEAFTGEDVRALERPEVEVTKYVPGETLEFTAECDVLPTVKLGDYRKLKYTPQSAKISTKQVDEVVDRILAQFTERREVTRAARDKDEVVIDFEGRRDGVKFDGGTAEGHTLLLGSGSFIPGFEEQIVGHSAGDEFDIEVTFPADYHAADLAGAAVTFGIKLKTVSEIVVPELTDELAAKVGPFTAADELRADIEREMAAREEQELMNAAKNDLIEQLLAKSKVPLPESLVVSQAESLKRDHDQNLTYQNSTLEQYLEQGGYTDMADWEAREVRPAAEKRIAVGLLIAELSKDMGVESTSEELVAELERYRQQYGSNEQALQQLESPETQREIANQILTNKTLDQLLELNTPKSATKKPAAKKPAAKKSTTKKPAAKKK